MIKQLRIQSFLFLLTATQLLAQNPAAPLLLPPGLQQTLPLVKSESYFADAVKIQDCPGDKDNPNGLCNNVLFGGFAKIRRAHV